MYLIEAMINNMAAILNFPCFNLLSSQIDLGLKFGTVEIFMLLYERHPQALL